MPREKSAGIIVFRLENSEPRYLLLHYAPSEPGRKGHWGFAKGHVEAGETEVQTAKRETKEETGLSDIKIVPGFKETEKYFFRQVYGLKGEARKKAPWIFKLVIFFLAETSVKDIEISDEHVGFLWLPFDEALKRITYKNSKELLKKANSFISLTKNRS